MLSVPFPLITLSALLILLATALFAQKQRHAGTLRFVLACIMLVTVSTLRWEYESSILRNIQSGLAIMLPPLAWHCFVSLTEIGRRRHLLLLFAPAALALIIRIVWPPATDPVLFLLFAGYGCSLLRLAWRGEHRFTLSRLSESPQTTKMAFFAGCFLCLSALTDLAVTFDFSLTGGRLAPAIVMGFQAALLPLIAAAIVIAGRPAAVAQAESKAALPTRAAPPEEELAKVYAGLEKQVRETELYLNPDLTLSLLARKTGIPARQLSGAVNAISQCNVSQWINGLRIERAQALLLSTPLPVTEIMFESGFTTKSNFNREFQRICGLSPTSFRQQAGGNPVPN
ncbi:helix-turn-helix domain-containing protein [Raoultella terrigena]|uniref:helix-turn-helix domain-containing protein n=1 Tax=Raoultella terrigena TaxID=577 RepID=UPI00349F9029